MCEKLLHFTNGHFYPFVNFAEHLLDPSNNVDLNYIDDYLSSKDFRYSSNCLKVAERFFPYLNSDLLCKAERLLFNQERAGDIEAL